MKVILFIALVCTIGFVSSTACAASGSTATAETPTWKTADQAATTCTVPASAGTFVHAKVTYGATTGLTAANVIVATYPNTGANAAPSKLTVTYTDGTTTATDSAVRTAIFTEYNVATIVWLLTEVSGSVTASAFKTTSYSADSASTAGAAACTVSPVSGVVTGGTTLTLTVTALSANSACNMAAITETAALAFGASLVIETFEITALLCAYNTKTTVGTYAVVKITNTTKAFTTADAKSVHCLVWTVAAKGVVAKVDFYTTAALFDAAKAAAASNSTMLTAGVATMIGFFLY
jgi:hypothetical protein